MDFVNISIEALNMPSLYPVMVTIVGALVILGIDLFSKNTSRSFYTILTIVFLLLDVGVVISYSGGLRGFFDVMLLDGLSILSQVIMLIASALFILLALTSKRYHEYSYPEYYALFLFMIAGFQFMVSSDNLILIFLGLETASLSLYAIIAMHNRTSAFEAAIKYFTMGAMAAGLYAFGSMILYGVSGTVEIYKIAEAVALNGESLMLFVGVGFILASIGFKVGLFPFHTWVPDVYEGSSAAVAGYLSIVPKIAAFVVAIRFFEFFIDLDILWVRDVLYIITVLTMTLPNMMALVQSDVKRMLAYSSISHAGFALAAIMIATTQSNSAFFLYWSLFLFTNLGAFTMLWVSRHKKHVWDDRFDHPYEKFSGLIKIMPVGAIIMAIFMLSLAGLPPFALFWGKLYLMSSAVNADYVILALIMAINSAISAYYYLKLIVYMFLKDPIVDTNTAYMRNASLALKTVLGISAIVVSFSFLIVSPLLNIIYQYVLKSGF
ncbi:MAG: NADH-quinone oxidoreductase subunit NuoN [Campylobacterales bacterium]